MKNIYFWGFIISAILLAKCNDPLSDSTYTMYENLPLGQYLESQPGFSEWVKMLKYSNTYNALNVKEDFTCFVQKNEALLDFIKEKYNCSSIEEMEKDEVSDLVCYHVIRGKQYKHNMFAEGRIADTTASGDFLVSGYGDAGINSIIINKEATIIERDIETVNAIVHVLNKPLTPVTYTIYDYLKENPDYTIFCQAVEATGLNEKLSEIRTTSGNLTFRVYNTLFAVTDEVYAGAGIQNFDQLIARISPGNPDYTQVGNPLYSYVAYHILTDYYSYTELAEFESSAATKVKNLNTYAPNELISVEDYKQELLINRTPATAIRLTGFNIAAKNGVIHQVDDIMEVSSPAPSKVDFDVTSGAEFKALDIYGLITGQYSATMEEGSISYIRWKTTPEGVGSVGYNVRNNFTQFINRDVLTVNLGSVGWIEIDLPTIAKGKYRVSIKHHKGPTRGTYQPFLDGSKLGGPVVFQSSGFSYPETTLGSVTFDKNASHVLKFVVVNPGLMEIDRITFEPEN